MEETSGFFEEMDIDDCEEVELSAVEEEFDTIDDFKESAVSNEIDGVLRESGIEENIIESDPEEGLEQTEQANNIRVIYVNKSTVSGSQESVSGNQVVLLDSAQFEVLVDEISSLKSDPVVVQTVSQNNYGEQLDRMEESIEGLMVVLIVLAGLCFGYFVKETIFRNT